MIPVLCIVVTCLAQEAPRTVGDPKLFDVLRAAQETNRTAFRSGAMNARVEQIFRKEKVLTNLEAEITWLEDKVIWKYREEQTVRDGATIAAGHMEKLPWNYMMRRGDKVYAYAASTGHVHIRSLSVVSLSFYEITPLDVWFRSCPPRGGGGGRLWSERIGPHPAFPQAAVESYEIAQRSADQIIQVRHDKNGAVVRTTFSLQACGNVVDDKYYPPGSSNPTIHYIYLWQTHPRGPCTLRSLTITDATTSKGDSFDTRYSLEVDKVTIEPPPDASFFTEQSFFRRLPPNTVIEDHVASGSTM